MPNCPVSKSCSSKSAELAPTRILVKESIVPSSGIEPTTSKSIVYKVPEPETVFVDVASFTSIHLIVCLKKSSTLPENDPG